MPSPFPGMDPYLEDPALWPDVHHRLISVSSELLLKQFRPRYFVQIEERVYIANDFDKARDLLIPDLRISEVNPEATRPTLSSGGGLAVAEPETGIELIWQFEIREGRIEIYDRDMNRVVTVLEFLSPANKVNGSASRKSYETKREEILSSDASLVEIDLLRHGMPLVGPSGLPPHTYQAQVWRWNGEKHCRRVWVMPLRNKLKSIPIPVRLGDKDGVLDLQTVIEIAYDRAGYDLRVNYRLPPYGTIQEQDEKWTRQTAWARPDVK